MNTEIMLPNNKIEIAKQTFPKELNNCNEANFEKLLKKIPITKFYKTISENKEYALSLVPSKFDDIKIVHFNNSVVRTTIQEFFNENQKPIKNINFNDELTNFLKKHKNIINKDAALFEQCLFLLAHNGHDEGAKYVKTVFDTKIIKFKNSIGELNNRISTEKENLQNISTVKPDNNHKTKIWGFERKNLNNIIINALNNRTESKKGKKRKKIGGFESQKGNLINNYSPFFEQIIDFYNHFIQSRLSDNDFDTSVLTESFLRICEDLYKFSEKEKKQNIGDSSIQKTLDSIIPSLIKSISKVETGNQNLQQSQDSRKDLYFKLNRIYQDLFKFTSCIDTKIALLKAYINNPDFPIVRYIIDDALKSNTNLEDENKNFIIDYIEQKYKQIQEINDEFDENNLEYLKNQNSAFIKNTNFPENIRKKAFDWYFNSEIIDNDKKNKFCWDIMEFIDKQDSLYDSCYHDIYNACETHLIIHETQDNILEKLEEFMDPAVSKGRIVSFINGVFYNIPDNNFSATAENYKNILDKKETFSTYNKKPWKEREKLKIKYETKLIED